MIVVNHLKYHIYSFYNKHRDVVNILILIALTFIVFYNSLGNYYSAADDFSNLLHTKRSYIKDLISNTYGMNSGGDYRPFEVIPHQLDRDLYGDDDPFERRLTNLIFHIFNVILVYLLGSYLTKKKWIGLIAGLFFAVHIIHGHSYSQPVTWISGRVEVFVTFFYLLTFILFIRFLSVNSGIIYLISLIGFVFALLSKEIAITLPVVILLYVSLFSVTKAEEAKSFKIIVKYILVGSILIIISGILFNTTIIAHLLSPDENLKNMTIDRIHHSQLIAITGGTITGTLILILFALVKYSNRARDILIRVRFSIPYFFIAAYYLIARFIFLGSLGGTYSSSSGNSLIFELPMDSIVRDLLALLGLFLPLGNGYVIEIYKLYTNHIYIFYLSGITILAALIIIFYKLIRNQSKLLLFNFLWIFITVLPVHNFILRHGGYETRYLYLSSVGFCIFISIFLFNISHKKFVYNRFTKSITLIFILLVVSFSSYAIINNNEELGKVNNKIEKFVSGLRKYRSQISDSTNLFFITSPISFVTENRDVVLNFRSNISKIVKMKMDEILNFSDNFKGYGKKYSYYFLLFVQGEYKDNIVLNWINESTFVVENINPGNYFVIVTEDSLIHQYGNEFNYINHGCSVFQPFSTAGEVKETNEAIIKVLEIDKKSNTAKLQVELNEKSYKAKFKNVFFLFENDGLKLVKTTSNFK